MRIAHVSATFPPYYAGMGNVCYYQARELARLGHQVSVFTAESREGDSDRVPNIRVHRLPAIFRFGNAPFLPGLLTLRDFDLFHLHMPYIFGAELTSLNARRRGLPCVVTYHMDLCGLDYRRLLFATYQTIALPFVLREAALIMPTTLDYARASRLAPFLAQRPDTVTAMPNGVDTEAFNPKIDSSGLRRHYGLAEGDRTVLFVAALDRAHLFKGLEVLLRALARLRADGIKALIVGDGSLKTSYMRFARSLGLGERVIFCGRVSQEQLPAHYALADCLVLPSINMGEAFGMVLLEAMACAKPVIASNLPGVRVVVSDGVDGLLVQPASVEDLQHKLEMMLADTTVRRDMGQRGRAKAEEKYAWPKIGQRLERFYQKVLTE